MLMRKLMPDEACPDGLEVVDPMLWRSLVRELDRASDVLHNIRVVVMGTPAIRINPVFRSVGGGYGGMIVMTANTYELSERLELPLTNPERAKAVAECVAQATGVREMLARHPTQPLRVSLGIGKTVALGEDKTYFRFATNLEEAASAAS